MKFFSITSTVFYYNIKKFTVSTLYKKSFYYFFGIIKVE
ncbi:hypothetical protein X925_08395 [Petrotoga sp. 9T1HF07.CasAA.8.2]|nr:hypothetical protein X925_08395 [Petrotoga sp. 9T1HF07.CasAA.8.2]PNR92205.1 hypothetical protein X926_06595 [Petrotoga sp. HWHPT.55.6.3]